MLKKLIDSLDAIPPTAIAKLGYMGVVLNFGGLVLFLMLLLFGLPGCAAAKPPLEHCMQEFLP